MFVPKNVLVGRQAASDTSMIRWLEARRVEPWATMRLKPVSAMLASGLSGVDRSFTLTVSPVAAISMLGTPGPLRGFKIASYVRAIFAQSSSRNTSALLR